MIKIICGKCKEGFRISEENIKSKTSVTCQNCGHEMSKELLENLASYATTKIEADSYFKKAHKLSYRRIEPKENFVNEIFWEISLED